MSVANIYCDALATVILTHCCQYDCSHINIREKKQGQSCVPFPVITLCLPLRWGSVGVSRPVPVKAPDWLELLIAALQHCHSRAGNAWATSKERDSTLG